MAIESTGIGLASIRGTTRIAQEFMLEDCSLVRCATGRACFNLRELLEALRSAGATVLEHHMMRLRA